MSHWKLWESYLINLLCLKCSLFIGFCVPILSSLAPLSELHFKLLFAMCVHSDSEVWNKSVLVHLMPASLFVVAAPGSSLRDDECKIWSGGLQQFTQAHLHLHPVLHRGHVAAHKVRGGAEGPGNQPELLQRPHAVLHLRGRSLHLLPHLRIPAGDLGTDDDIKHLKWLFTRLLAEWNWREVCRDTFVGADIFSGGIQAFRMVPHPGPVWILFHVWTRGAPAHAGQTQEVRNRILSHHPSWSSFAQSSRHK